MFIESGFDGSFGTYTEAPPPAGIAACLDDPHPVKGVYRLYIDCGRMGSLEGIFWDTDVGIKDHVGKRFYAGEALGKHSDISGVFKEEMFTLVTDDIVAVSAFIKYNFSSGWDPSSLLEE